MQSTKRYLALLACLVIIIVSYLIIKPYLSAVLTGFVLAYLAMPVYNYLNRKIKISWLSASITTVLVVLIIFLPLIFLANTLIRESVEIYRLIMEKNLLSVFVDKIGLNLEKTTSLAATLVQNITSYAIKTVPLQLLGFVITIFTLYYFLKDNERIIAMLKSIMPFKNHQNEILYSRFKNITSSVIYGLVFTGILEAILLTIVFYITGIKVPLFWGLIVFILALLPVLGPSLIWVPMAVLKLAAGEITNGIILIIFGIVVMSGIENFLRPKIIGKRTGVHSVLILLGIIGGIPLFGFIGIIIGPLVLSICMEIIKFYKGKEI